MIGRASEFVELVPRQLARAELATQHTQDSTPRPFSHACLRTMHCDMQSAAYGSARGVSRERRYDGGPPPQIRDTIYRVF